MRFLSLFSGIEAASCAWLPLGWECVAVAEIEKFPSTVLAVHYPEVPNLGDITKITEKQIKSLGHIDLVVGGFPCQDLSVAGKRKGLKNEDGTNTRSGLFFDAMRIVRWSNARYLLIENVPGLYSSNEGRDFAAVVGEILGVEFDIPRNGWKNTGVAASQAGLLEWATLDAQWFGVPQRRRRFFAFADFGDWTSRPPVLFERHSMSGNPAPSREKKEDIAGTIRASAARRGGTQDECGLGLQPVAFGGNNTTGSIDVATARNACASASGRMDFESETFIVGPTVSTLDASFGKLQGCSGQDANHGHSHLVPVAIQAGALRENPASGPDGVGVQEHIAYTLEARAEVQAIAFNAKDHGADASFDISPTLRAGAHDESHANSGNWMAVAVAENQRGELRVGEISDSLKCSGGKPGQGYAAALVGMQVRRLTPMECERLQGFPDGWTDIPVKGKPAPDGPRYKALGNSMAVPVMSWIGRRIQMMEDILTKISKKDAA